MSNAPMLISNSQIDILKSEIRYIPIEYLLNL
jgi:hypothetical protein